MRSLLQTLLLFLIAVFLLAECAPSPALARPPLVEEGDFRELYRHIGRAEAARHGVPFALIDAVMWVESGYNAKAVGGVGEIGLMQVRPSTAAMMGFTGTLARLAEPATNIAYGARYLAQAWRLARGDICTTVMKYRAGHGERRFTPLSVHYCRRVQIHLGNAALGTPVEMAAFSADLPPAAKPRTSRNKDCFRRVVQPGRRFGACIPRSVLVKKGLLRKA
jgi:soluble lytic murein transglycosylase-like protein